MGKGEITCNFSHHCKGGENKICMFLVKFFFITQFYQKSLEKDLNGRILDIE